MSKNYNVRVTTNTKKVSLSPSNKYTLGVNYEIPSKSQQYDNIILDDISGLFDGSTQTFPLTDDGDSYFPLNDQQLIVSFNDVILEPSVDYTIAGSSIIFTNPPQVGDEVWINALVTTADLTRTINFIVDSGSLPMEPGNKGSLTLDVSGTIESVTLLSDHTGRLEVDIKKSNYLVYPNFSSIVGGNRPLIFDSNKQFDDVLNNWDNTLQAGDILQFEVIYSINITRFLIALKLKL
jgi:hypothetical protein